MSTLIIIGLPLLALALLVGGLDYGMALVAAWRARAAARTSRALCAYHRGSGGADTPGGRAALWARVWPALREG
jgi:hypothetical protein